MLAIENVQCGLRKALMEECRDIVYFHLERLSYWLARLPAERLEWRIGRTGSWPVVKEQEYRIELINSDLEKLAMATKNKKNRKASNLEKYEFVRCQLSAEDKKAAKVWIEENISDLGPMLHDVLASDYKYSCSFSSDYDTFTASFTGKPDAAINAYKTLTSRHSDWIQATMSLLYKHAVLFKSGVWESEDEDDDDGWA